MTRGNAGRNVKSATLQQVPMKPDHLCRVGKGARADSFRLSCELDRARRAHAVGCQWWARRAKRAFAHLTIQIRAGRAVDAIGRADPNRSTLCKSRAT